MLSFMYLETTLMYINVIINQLREHPNHMHLHINALRRRDYMSMVYKITAILVQI